MPPKTPLLIVAGATAVAAIAGVTVAVRQPTAPDVSILPANGPTDLASQPSPPPPSPQPPAAPKAPPIAPAAPPATPQPSSPPVAPAEPQRDVESCVVKMAIANDPNPPLNVRAAPTTESAIVGTIPNGTWITVEAEQPGWFRVSNPAPGWISQQRTNHTCGIKTERVSFGNNGTLATITDQFIGTGSHTYRFNARQGQTMRILRQRGPFPAIQAPDGTYLVASGSGDENRPSWVGTLAQNGDYQFILDSNFKGYKYSFDVEIK